ncbi:conserved hypothetical protein [Frankia canadensis]|uniref:AAA+ ATPase domain-containing protein n=1 Tax=Frankia canadensis TaxID=1836972 RepID=A0A2I2KZN8_9ACTN|nr:MoxR family ATPase [Frankia canadensis]SNQ51134.1 conserved hypothetical protein [Frankia canadensis]SOU58424.1 conserved hypothetical protein [Frankia canadensis]
MIADGVEAVGADDGVLRTNASIPDGREDTYPVRRTSTGRRPAGSPVEGGEPPAWWLVHGTGQPRAEAVQWPPAPPSRRFTAAPNDLSTPAEEDERAARRRADLGAALLDRGQLPAINAGIALRRPLVVVGPAGSGRRELAYLIARELGLGRVLRWSVNGRTLLRDGVFDDDQAGFVHALFRPPAGEVADGSLRLGPLATALLARRRPRVLLVEGLDRADVDLPDDLVEVIDGGRIRVPGLLAAAMSAQGAADVATDDPGGVTTLDSNVVQCAEFPIIVISVLDDRELPTALRRRCVRVRSAAPSAQTLRRLLEGRFGPDPRFADLVDRFVARRSAGAGLVVDQLVDLAQLALTGALDGDGGLEVIDAVWAAPADETFPSMP